ncbi:hypothetical protein X975_12856, partial [Stegodyphus mimosarum]
MKIFQIFNNSFKMWIPDDDPGYQDDCSKEQGSEKIKFRSNS